MVSVRHKAMGTRFIDDYQVLLLDMGNTFMFGGDRFGDGEDYYATYQQAGGTTLSSEEVHMHITDVFRRMLTAARDPSCVDDFGDVARFLRTSETTSGVSMAEQDLLIKVFSRHEVGTIDDAHVHALHRLRASHTLGLVSNVWSPSGIFESALQEAGVRDLFSVRVWSSDHLSIKPSARLFQKALQGFSISPERVVYVGDNPKRDVAGAKAVGMATVWIENETRPLMPDMPEPDHVVADLIQLLDEGIQKRNGRTKECRRRGTPRT